MGQAIAAFERTVVSGPSPFDEFLQGKKTALDARQIRGLDLFLTKGKCTACHRGPFLTTGSYAKSHISSDPGPAEVTKDPSDASKFRVPTLRNVAMTAPFFHDGSITNLEDAVFIRANGAKREDLAKEASSLTLSDEEVKDVTAFLRALNGQLPRIAVPTQFPQLIGAGARTGSEPRGSGSLRPLPTALAGSGIAPRVA